MNNTIVSNIGGGIAIDSSGGIIKNNIIAFNNDPMISMAGVLVDGASCLTTLTHNLLFSNGYDHLMAPNCSSTPNATNNFSGQNPNFVDAPNHDYHIATGSPAIDTGDSLYTPAADLEGKPRPIDGNGDGQSLVDIGAYEFGNLSPIADAGLNLAVSSEDQGAMTIHGTAIDLDGNLLNYRWREGSIELSSWEPVGPNGEAYLDLSQVLLFPIGEHTLTLEVSDGQSTSTDDMILTIR